MELVIPTLLSLATALAAAEITLQPPLYPHFNSVNTENILHWSPAENGPQHIRYDVQYQRYGYDEETIPVSHCTGIPHCYCDLTEQTWDVNITYFASVRSVLGNTTSTWKRTMFKPFDSTLLGLPSFVTKVEHDVITVRLFPPTLYTAKRNRSMGDVYPQELKYTIYIHANDTDTSEEIHSSGAPVKTTVRLGNIYCIRVRVHLHGDPRKSNITEEKCIQIPTPNPDLETLINTVVGVIGATITLFVLCVCLAMFCWCYLKERRMTPAVLETFGKNRKFLSKMDYLSLTENVELQKVFADGAHHNVTKILDLDDPWPEQKMREASSVDSGIDIGSHSPGRIVLIDEVMNLYRQQTPDSSGIQSTNSSGIQSTNSSGVQSTNSSGVQSTNSSGAQSTNSSGVQSTNSSGAQSTNSSGAQSTNSSGAQSTVSECGQTSFQPVSVCSVHIPAAGPDLGDCSGGMADLGYQRQLPRFNDDSVAAMSSVLPEPALDFPPCTLSISDITVAQDFTNTFLTLSDVMLMDDEL